MELVIYLFIKGMRISVGVHNLLKIHNRIPIPKAHFCNLRFAPLTRPGPNDMRLTHGVET